MTSAWYQVSCEVPAPLAEAVADCLTELSGCGVCTDNRNVDTFSPDDIPNPASVTISSYFGVPCPIEEHLTTLAGFLNQQSATFPGYRPTPPTVSLIAEEDWASSWKEHFKPLPIGERLLIIPSWETPAATERRQIITLDPGMAFGTGGHETTRLCLECLEQILTDGLQADAPVLDLGTGSGILAIAAAKLGVRRIDAVDIDPQAVLVADENCRLNRVSDAVSCSTTPLEQLPDGYRLILANILAEELVRMAPELTRRLRPDGLLVLSGILAEREQFVVDGFASQPLTLEASLAAGEWRCLRYRRQP
ncbi:MAG: 50S ribosomal protein L11 methyltransferase [Trichlorobacter sp.]|jgi:ribosomal protein L11 methyltransferase